MQDRERLERALRAAHNAGDTQAATRLAQALRDAPAGAPLQSELERTRQAFEGNNLSRAEAFDRGATNGATFGWGDELAGNVAGLFTRGYNAATGSQINPDTMGTMVRERMRSDLEEAREQHPVSTGAGEFTGGAATTLAGGAALAPTRLGTAGGTLLRSRPVAGGALIGSAEGAAIGAGEGSGDMGDRAGGAMLGAGFGGAFGAGAPVALRGLYQGGSGSLRVLSRAYRRNRAGANLTRDQRRAWGRLLNDAQAAGVSEEDIVRSLDDLRATGLTDEQAVFELLGDNAVERARGGVATGNSNAIQGRDRINARQSQQPARIQDALRRDLGADGNEFSQAREALRSPTALENARYAQFREGRNMSRYDIDGFMQSDRFRRIAAEAAQDIQDGAGGRAINIDEDEFSPALVDAIKRRMDRMIRDAEGGAVSNTAASRPLRELRDRWVAFADEAYPDYAPARAEAQVRLSAREALEEGRQIFRTDNVRNPEELAAMVRGMNDEQLLRFRQGVARGITDQVNAAPRNVVQANGQAIATSRDASNPISRFWNRADRQEALRAAFGDEATFERFVRRMAVEGDRAENFRRVSTRTQGSPTQANLRAAQVSEGMADVAEVATGNPLGAAIRQIQRRVRAGDPNLEAEIQRILWSTLPEQRPQLLEVLSSRGIITRDRARALEAATLLSAPLTAGATSVAFGD